jgi:Xaa-Pro aminopeptidase
MKTKFSAIGCKKEQLKDIVRESQFSSMIITSPEMIQYVTGYPVLPSSGNPILFAIRNVYPFYVVINAEGKIFLIAWEYSVLDITLDVDSILVHSDRFEAKEKLRELLESEIALGEPVGIESTCPFWLCNLITEVVAPKRFVEIDSILNDLRYVKSDQEIELMKKSTAIVEKSVVELFEFIHSGIGRSQVIQESKRLMIENGASGIGHCTISFGASNPEVEIDERLEANKLVVLDLGAKYYGYASDNRRYGYTGKIPKYLTNMYQTMCEIVNTMGNNLAPGVTGRQLFFLAQDLFRKNDLDPLFRHVGHTMGLQTEEVWFDEQCEKELSPGVILNIELYNMLQTGENIGNEETYLITEKGNMRLTSLPQKIIELN